MSESQAPLTTGLYLFERYRILTLLGQGGMSRVYLAEDARLNLRVAIKENLQSDVYARTQFQREAQLLAMLSHPHLPRVTDHFDDGATGRQFFVMDYIDGEDLQARVERLGPLSELDVTRWTNEILDALDYLHSRTPPVIHRDIKPSNIVITTRDKAVLVDFGIHKTYYPQEQTMTGARKVTGGYAPPEAYGMFTDQRSDIYAVGATLYRLATGQVPPESTMRTSNLIPLTPPRRLRPELSPAFERAILVAMDIDPKKRWQSVKEFRAAVASPTPVKPPAVEELGQTVPRESRAPAPSPTSPKLPVASERTMAAEVPHTRPSAEKSSRNPTPIIAALGVLALCLVVALGSVLFVAARGIPGSSPTATLIALPVVPQPTLPAIASSPSQSPLVDLVIANNFGSNQDFFVDGNLAAPIDSGKYTILQIKRGSHQLAACARGRNPKDNASACNVKTADLNRTPYDWEIFGNAAPGGNVNLVVLNNSPLKIDFFVDGQLTSAVDAAKYGLVQVPPGNHALQACPRGNNPKDNPGKCGDAQTKNVQTATFLWTITD